MKWLDKAKQVAGDAASQVKSKVEETQTRKRADEAAKKLGYLIHRERTGGQAAGPEADALVAEITAAQEELEAKRASAAAEGKAVDPVCGMTVEIAATTLSTEHGGTTYYFCSQTCLDGFTADPAAFATA